MTVERDYMLEKPPGPSALKRFFDQRVVPAAVNTASRLEFALDDAARSTGVRPSIILSAGVGALAFLGWFLVRSRTSLRRRMV